MEYHLLPINNYHCKQITNFNKCSVLLAVLMAICSAIATPSFAKSVSLYRATAAGTPVMVLSVDMSDPGVKVSGIVAQGGCGSSERFNDMVSRAHPTAAVTGTFFSPGSNIPIGDIVVDGRLAHRGGVGTALCITQDNQCDFIQPPYRYCRMDWSQYDFVCTSGPRLLHNRLPYVYPHSEGFRDSHLLHSATRLAVGITAKHKLLFVTTRCKVQLGQMGRAMRGLGCVDAIALDAGSSLGFYNNGNMLIQPNRKLTNAILIYDDINRYEKYKGRLIPPKLDLADSR